jgi:hypothetical protein
MYPLRHVKSLLGRTVGDSGLLRAVGALGASEQAAINAAAPIIKSTFFTSTSEGTTDSLD